MLTRSLERWRRPALGALGLGIVVGLCSTAGERLWPGVGLPLGIGLSTAMLALANWVTYRKLQDTTARTLHTMRVELASLTMLEALAPGFLPHSIWSLEPHVLVRLLHQVGIRHATNLVECGSGVSTLLMAAYLRSNGQRGRVYALEHDSNWATYVRTLISNYQLDDYATVIDAPLETQSLDGETVSWYSPRAIAKLPDDRFVDVLLVDGPPGATSKLARYPAIPVLLPRLSPNALVILDDANRPDESHIAMLWGKLLDLRPTLFSQGRGQWEFDLATSRDLAGN